jgi:16S rRNA (uracil1498-N3)-methyltransferase
VIHALRHSAAHVFVDQLDLPVLGDDDQHHLGRVLRLRDGESVTASNGRGQWRACVWRDGALEVAGEVVASAPPSVRCAVAFTPVKGDRNEWAVQKLTEIGIDEIVILAPTQHSVVRWSDADKQLRKLRVVAREAAMQSRRVWLPNIVGLAALREVCARDGAAVADPNGVALHAGVSLVVVGPEGGFAEDELPAGVPRVQLGDTILRAETATLVAATLLVARRASS